ncbi:MAG: hypothetical protein JRH03_09755 [Deltaproteobacteria bacterium]|nr:hypothetical protein [Deltaproteobacteria bacterium]
MLSAEWSDNGQPKIVVDGIRVDMQALKSIQHRCLPEVCRGAPNCCSRYQIHVGEKELETIVGFLPLVEKYTASIGKDLEYENVFDAVGNGCFIIDADENEQCVFAYTTAAEETLCSLHSAAIDLDLSPLDVKPKCCSIWPLTLSDGPEPELSVDPKFTSFPCNRKKPAPEGIDSGIQETIRIYFGESFLSELLAKAGC